MGIFDKLRNEFIDIIEWLDPTREILVYRFERYQQEIKNGAKLTVRESQVAVFVNEGQVADVYGPGMYTLTTENMPIMTTLKGWKYGFNSPFKAEVYFVNTRVFTDQKWGTPNPIMMRDVEFGPVRIRAFGNYTFNISDAGKFVTQIVGTDGLFTVDEIGGQLRNIIITRFSDALAEANIPVLDMARKYDDVSQLIQDKIKPEFEEYGLNLSKFLISNITLPEEVEKVMDKRTSMGVVGDLNRYTQFQTAQAIENSSTHSGGGVSDGLNMAMGFGLASQMMNQMNRNFGGGGGAPVPPPLPGQSSYYIAVNGQQQGPYDMNSLRQYIANKQVTADTLVWKEGMAQWTAANGVDELKGLFGGATPPPIPGA